MGGEGDSDCDRALEWDVLGTMRFVRSDVPKKMVAETHAATVRAVRSMGDHGG